MGYHESCIKKKPSWHLSTLSENYVNMLKFLNKWISLGLSYIILLMERAEFRELS